MYCKDRQLQIDRWNRQIHWKKDTHFSRLGWLTYLVDFAVENVELQNKGRVSKYFKLHRKLYKLCRDGRAGYPVSKFLPDNRIKLFYSAFTGYPANVSEIRSDIRYPAKKDRSGLSLIWILVFTLQQRFIHIKSNQFPDISKHSFVNLPRPS